MYTLQDFRISLDRKEAGSDIDFISHAHSDHVAAAKSTKNAIMSDATADLIKAAYGIGIDGKQLNITKGLKLLNAGHILGSKQLVVEDGGDDGRVVYSGDFQVSESRAAERIEIENADTLVLDSTYPQNGIKFDDRDIVERKILDWTKEKLEKGIVIFKAYSIGKAQELIKIFNGEGICPVVSKKVSHVNRVYKKYGVDLQYVSAFEDADHEPAIKGTFVGITEKSIDKLKPKLGLVHDKKVFTAVATGFASIYRFNSDAQFDLSDHADFRQRLEYIEGVSPKRIFTYGKDARELANNLSRAGYQANVYEAKSVLCKRLVEETIELSKTTKIHASNRTAGTFE